jgi:hypothetical protein
MGRPKPLEHGDQAHLVWGSIRWSIARSMRLLADACGGSRQYEALLAGADVELTREQVAGFLSPSRQPADLGEHPAWVLSGDDELTPAP